ncbi:MAG: hypothetical protein ABR503_05730 [Chitinophagaceae bacterium]
MGKKENDIDDKNKKPEDGEVKSSDIENAHATGDGSLGRDEETLIAKSTEDKMDTIKKDAEKY